MRTGLVLARQAVHLHRAGLLAVVLIVLPLRGASGQGSDLQDPACASNGTRQLYALRAFFGYACEDESCAAHKAGFAWADRSGITDPQACRDAGHDAFSEGCRAFAEDAVTAEQSGFEWARENEVVDPCLCRGAGPRFEAGCEAYVTGFAR